MQPTASPGSRDSTRTVPWGPGTALVVGLVFAMALLGRSRPMTLSLAMAMAGLGTAGTFLMAWLVSRRSAYPRWAWYATAGVMSAALILSVFVAPDPEAWKGDVRPTAWMLPWFLLIMGLTPPRRSGICAPSDRRSGWIMVGTGVVLSVILVSANLIADWIQTIWRSA
jgi:hypothetical protein